MLNKIQEPGIDLATLLGRARSLPGNFSVYYNPEKLNDVILLDGDKYVNDKFIPIRVKRCSSIDFVKLIENKIDAHKVVQSSLF